MEYIPIAFTSEEVEALLTQLKKHPTDYTPLGVCKLKLQQGLELHNHRSMIPQSTTDAGTGLANVRH